MMEEYSERQQHMDNLRKRRDIDACEGEPAMKRLKSPTSDESPRGVSFSKETKVFDGLSPASRLVDSVVWDFFMSQTVNSAGDIVQLFAHISDSCGCLHEVCDLLDDLRQRLDDSGCALVLPGGACVASAAPRAPSPHPRAVSRPFPRHFSLSLSRALAHLLPLSSSRAHHRPDSHQAEAAARSFKRSTRPHSASCATSRGRRMMI